MLSSTLKKENEHRGLKREWETGGSAAATDDNHVHVSPARAPKALKSTDTDDAKKPTDDVKTPPRAAPYFFYTDHSREADDDPLTPVTPRNSVPSFPIKLHAILSMPEYSDILAWDTHGRSFRILKPKCFERDIVPKYFEHTKLSSFTRQVNGWGFRRLTEGENMGSYYEENFLRSMPWLVKNMRRPKVGEKKSLSNQYEPDLAAISREFPVPNHPMTREIQVVLETIKNGAKAKVPEHFLLDGDEFGLAINSIDQELKPAALPGKYAQANASVTTAAASQPAPPQAYGDASFQSLAQAVRQNTSDPFAALLNRASAPMPPVPASKLLNDLLLGALQQQKTHVDSIAAAPGMYNQTGYSAVHGIAGGAAQLNLHINHAASMAVTQHRPGQAPFFGCMGHTQQPRLVSPETLLQSLRQNPSAASIPNSNTYNGTTSSAIPMLIASQVQGMTTEQLQSLLKNLTRGPSRL